jgi:hypothetical protein
MDIVILGTVSARMAIEGPPAIVRHPILLPNAPSYYNGTVELRLQHLNVFPAVLVG